MILNLMKRTINLICLVCLLTAVNAQYYGGSDDGSVIIACARTPLNDQEFYCTGGMDDGFALAASGTVTLNDQTLYCYGGSGDGTESGSIAGFFFNPVLYFAGGIDDGAGSLYSGNAQIGDLFVYSSGGEGDGSHELGYYGAICYPVSWLGGIADGFSVLGSGATGIGPSLHCNGGCDDGASGLLMPASFFGRGIWLGAVSSAWAIPANWSFDYVPDLSVNVLIPAGKPHYPLILQGNLSVNSSAAGNYCKSLVIQQGGTLTNKSWLYVDGEVSIYGLYMADDPNNRMVVVNPGGNLHLFDPGIMRIGNQE